MAENPVKLSAKPRALAIVRKAPERPLLDLEEESDIGDV